MEQLRKKTRQEVEEKSKKEFQAKLKLIEKSKGETMKQIEQTKNKLKRDTEKIRQQEEQKYKKEYQIQLNKMETSKETALEQLKKKNDG